MNYNFRLNQPSKYWYIKGGQLFSQLSEADYQELDWISCMIHCQKSDFIYLPDQNHRKVYYLKQGLVKLGYYDDDGNEILLDILKPGDVFGEISFGALKNQGEFAQSIMNNTKLCNFDMNQLEHVLTRNPTLALRLSKKIGAQQLSVTRRFTKIIYKDARTRIIEFIKDWVQDENITNQTEITLANHLTQTEIAALNGLARQTVSTLFNELKSNKLLYFERTKIYIPNLRMLK